MEKLGEYTFQTFYPDSPLRIPGGISNLQNKPFIVN